MNEVIKTFSQIHTCFNGMKLRSVCNSIISCVKLFRPLFGWHYIPYRVLPLSDHQCIILHSRIGDIVKPYSNRYSLLSSILTLKSHPVSRTLYICSRTKAIENRSHISIVLMVWWWFSLSNLFDSFMSLPPISICLSYVLYTQHLNEKKKCVASKIRQSKL